VLEQPLEQENQLVDWDWLEILAVVDNLHVSCKDGAERHLILVFKFYFDDPLIDLHSEEYL
jgi:hypothetical protein